MRLSAFLGTVFALLTVLPLSAFADIKFTSPDANADWAANSPVTLEWKDDGRDPPLETFTTFTVWLCYGSNDNPLCGPTLGAPSSKFSPSTTSTKFTIDPPMGQATSKKVYFLKMQTTAAAGGYTWNYSPRFSISGMTGKFPPAALAEQVKGDVATPKRVDTTVDAAAPAAGADQAKVPYTEQTGSTRFAPMQTQPGSRITAKSPSRQYPTSSYSVFRTKAGPPVVQTTITQSWDYTRASKENTASPAPRPLVVADDMQKFLNRWKD